MSKILKEKNIFKWERLIAKATNETENENVDTGIISVLVMR